MATTTTLPVLLPATATPQLASSSHLEWSPKKYRTAPQPPPQDDARNQEIELANARQMLDGKIIKKTRPRRTVDYNGGMGRWTLVCLSWNIHLDSNLMRCRFGNYGLIHCMYRVYAPVHHISLMYETPTFHPLGGH